VVLLFVPVGRNVTIQLMRDKISDCEEYDFDSCFLNFAASFG
jgi:hypothetical protein